MSVRTDSGDGLDVAFLGLTARVSPYPFPSLEDDVRKTIGFLLIGAQKSGTTSLFHYLRTHPAIYMPPEKELAFWSDPAKVALGLDWYLDHYFRTADPSCLWGEASTHYMCYGGTARRIADIIPDVKLVAVLRNPIDRAYSHYRMALRRGREDRSFETSVEELIARGPLSDEGIDMDKEFVIFGEYGRILSEYRACFQARQLGVFFMDEMLADSRAFMRRVLEFLGLAPDVDSPVFAKSFHRSGNRRFSALDRSKLYTLVRGSARKLVPPQTRRKIGFWIETELNVRPTRDVGPSPEARRMLAAHYRRDIAKLEELLQRQVPWAELTEMPGTAARGVVA